MSEGAGPALEVVLRRLAVLSVPIGGGCIPPSPPLPRASVDYARPLSSHFVFKYKDSAGETLARARAVRRECPALSLPATSDRHAARILLPRRCTLQGALCARCQARMLLSTPARPPVVESFGFHLQMSETRAVSFTPATSTRSSSESAA